jgi:HrpA-like RNA helicase
VRPGLALHLFSRARAAAMAEFAVPELLRTPLDELALTIKLLVAPRSEEEEEGGGGGGSRRRGRGARGGSGGGGLLLPPADAASAGTSDIERFLALAMQPPPREAVRSAIETLRNIGALRPRVARVPLPPGAGAGAALVLEDELTPLGARLARLPIAPRLGKMLLLAALFRCLDPVLTLVAAMASRPPWVLPLVSADKARADRARVALAGGARSDHLALLGAFAGFHAARRRGGGAPFSGAESGWCRDNFVSAPTLNMVTATRAQLLGELVRAGALDAVAAAAAGGGGGGGVPRPLGIDVPAHAAALGGASVNAGNTALVLSVLAAGM